jgi:hypothetical protein
VHAFNHTIHEFNLDKVLINNLMLHYTEFYIIKHVHEYKDVIIYGIIFLYFYSNYAEYSKCANCTAKHICPEEQDKLREILAERWSIFCDGDQPASWLATSECILDIHCKHLKHTMCYSLLSLYKSDIKFANNK